MCCLVTIIALIGPRMGIFVWWLFDMSRWNTAFSTFVWPLLGFIFLPWATLAYVWVFSGGVNGFDWVWLILGFILDISFYTGGGYGNRNRLHV